MLCTGLLTKGAVTGVPRQREGRVWARSKVVKMGRSEFISLELKEKKNLMTTEAVNKI